MSEFDPTNDEQKNDSPAQPVEVAPENGVPAGALEVADDEHANTTHAEDNDPLSHVGDEVREDDTKENS